MTCHAITADLSIAELLAYCPQAMYVFFRHRMACVGCVMAPYEDVSVVAANYGLPVAQFLEELAQSAIGRGHTGPLAV
jgi:hybrid cluster-associated redox disulfide protein